MRNHLTDGELRASLDGELDISHLKHLEILFRLPGTSTADTGAKSADFPPTCISHIRQTSLSHLRGKPGAASLKNYLLKRRILCSKNGLPSRWYVSGPP